MIMNRLTRESIQTRFSQSDPIKDLRDGILIGEEETAYIVDFNSETEIPIFMDSQTFAFSFSTCPNGLLAPFRSYAFLVRFRDQNQWLDFGELSQMGRRKFEFSKEDCFVFRLKSPLSDEAYSSLKKEIENEKSRSRPVKVNPSKLLKSLNTNSPESVVNFIESVVGCFDPNCAQFFKNLSMSETSEILGRWSCAYKLIETWMTQRSIPHFTIVPEAQLDSVGGYTVFLNDGSNYLWAISGPDLTVYGRSQEEKDELWSWSQSDFGKFLATLALRIACDISARAHCESERSPSKVLGRKFSKLDLQMSPFNEALYSANGLLALVSNLEPGYSYSLASGDLESIEHFINDVREGEDDWVV
jgi:hypothetical protein